MSQLLRKTEDQNRKGITGDLWKNFPVDEILALRDFNSGYGVYPNLASFDSAVDAAAATVLYGSEGARGYIDTGCTISQMTKAQLGTAGAGLRLATTTTDNGEVNVQWCGIGEPFTISDTAADQLDLVFECAFRIDSIADSVAGFFIGLMEGASSGADVITDAGALADKDYIGFHGLEGDGDTLDVVYKKNGQTAQTVKADWKTIAADTWYHVGMRYYTKNKTVKFWFGTGDRSTTRMAEDADNIVNSTNIAAATFPDGEGLAPIIAMKNAATTAVNLDIRLLAVAQATGAAT